MIEYPVASRKQKDEIFFLCSHSSQVTDIPIRATSVALILLSGDETQSLLISDGIPCGALSRGLT